MNSAWRVPFRVALVAFWPRAIMVPLCTRTQPTGVSSVERACSAWMEGSSQYVNGMEAVRVWGLSGGREIGESVEWDEVAF
jgi:hypothetical protein